MDVSKSHVAKRTRRDDVRPNLDEGRKRFKVTGPGSSMVESEDQDLSAVGARKGESSTFSNPLCREKGGIDTDVADKGKCKQASFGKNMKKHCDGDGDNGSDDDDLEIICEVFNSHVKKFVKIGGNNEVEYTIEKNRDVLQFVQEKKLEISDGRFVWEDFGTKKVDEGKKEGRKGLKICDLGKNKVGDEEEERGYDDDQKNVYPSSDEADSDYIRAHEEADSDALVSDAEMKNGNAVRGMVNDGRNGMEEMDVDREWYEDEAKKEVDGDRSCGEYVCKDGGKSQINPMTTKRYTDMISGVNARNGVNICDLGKNKVVDEHEDSGDDDDNCHYHSDPPCVYPSSDEADSYYIRVLEESYSDALVSDADTKSGNAVGGTVDDGINGKEEMDVEDGGESQIYPVTTGRNSDMTAGVNARNVGQILANSLLDTEEGHLEMFGVSKEIEPAIDKSMYKFRFPDEDTKPVAKSEFEVELDGLFAALNMSLTSEQIGSTTLEDNRGAHITTKTDRATLCSQGSHFVVLNDPVGLVCKYCSHVELESRHMLPDFSKPTPRRHGKSIFTQAESAQYPYFPDHIQGTGTKDYGIEDYNNLETVWDLIPGTRRSLYEHQREGFEFIWKNLVGETVIEKLEKPLSSSGHGCIISHAPGTGKTRLTIVFLQSFMKMYPDSRPVIMAPKSLLLTWEEEFKKWNFNIPFHNLNNPEFTGKENAAAASLLKKGMGNKNNETDTRLVKLFSWKMGKSILGITYQLFENIVGAVTRNPDCNAIVQNMGTALLKFPTLLVLDEGHTPRNKESNIYQFLLKIETERRIILSGTPFQNNFDELYNTLCLVNSEFGRTLSKDGHVLKTKNRKISRESKSKWVSLTHNISGDDGEKLRELKSLIDPFVHVHKGTILQKKCPGLTDAMILLRPTKLQQELITLLKEKSGTNFLQFSRVMSIVSVHPSLLPKEWFEEEQFSAYRNILERLKTDPYAGTKTKFIIELCRLSEALDEKVLIFCQYLDPLTFIKDQLLTQFRWIQGREVLYMDGSLEPKQRQSSINALNDPKSNVRVLLASIKACSEGIHLVGASRVVLLDVVWNPSIERQAISRAYRIGQKKMVYTYHLIVERTEMDKYNKQLMKDRLSELVFSSKDQLDKCKKKMRDMVPEDDILQEMFQRNDKLGDMIEQIRYHPKELNLVHSFDSVADQ